MPKIILVYNYKGGVGKSIISYNLAAGLAQVGPKVLLANVDGQNNSVNVFAKTEVSTSIYDLLQTPRLTIDQIKIPLTNNLDGLNSKNLTDINIELTEKRDRLNECFDYMFPKEELKEYDYFIFDCGPQEVMINAMLLINANGIIMPVSADFEGVEATQNTFAYLDYLGLDRDLIKLVVPNMVSNSTGSKIALKTIETLFNKRIMTMPIPRRVAINYAATCGTSIYEYTQEQMIIDPFINLLEKTMEVF